MKLIKPKVNVGDKVLVVSPRNKSNKWEEATVHSMELHVCNAYSYWLYDVFLDRKMPELTKDGRQRIGTIKRLKKWRKNENSARCSE